MARKNSFRATAAASTSQLQLGDSRPSDSPLLLSTRTDVSASLGHELRKARVSDSLLLSAASVWEISIKAALGKLPLPLPASRYVPERMRTSGTEGLPIQLLHTAVAGELPLHHHDPFDRLLVAQSQILDIPLVTSDEQLSDYDAEII